MYISQCFLQTLFKKHDINNYNSGHKGLNCAILIISFFNSLKKKEKEKTKKLTVTSYPSHTMKQPSRTISPNFLTRI